MRTAGLPMWLSALCLVGVIASPVLGAAATDAPSEHWVATWATSQQMAPTTPDRPQVAPDVKMPDFSKMKLPAGLGTVPAKVENQTVRMPVRVTIGGTRVRVELSNAFGAGDTSIAAAHVAVRASGSATVPGTDRTLTFGGSKALILRPGQVISSEPVDLDVRPMADLVVSLFVLNSNGKPSIHPLGLHTSYIAAGDQTAAAQISGATENPMYLWLRSVDVTAPASASTIVCLGDSITDGFGTTLNKDKAWPTLLGERLAAQGHAEVAVVNEGISGNEVLRDGAGVSALARLDRDVLSLPGVRWIVLLEGINDINLHGQITGLGALTVDDLIQGDREIIARAHSLGIRVVGATLTPEKGVWLAGPIGEKTREALNAWIRTSHAFDAVVDFDAVIRDPSHPSRMLPELNPGDNIHPNDVGNQRMADAFDLSVFAR